MRLWNSGGRSLTPQGGSGVFFSAWISVDLQEETAVSLGNALPTETTTAAVDSCPVLQTRTNERGESGKRAALLRREWKV